MPTIGDIYKSMIEVEEDKPMASNMQPPMSMLPKKVMLNTGQITKEKLSDGLFTQIQDMDNQLIHLQGQVNAMKEQSEHQTRMLEFLCMRGHGKIPEKPEKPKPKKPGERNILV